jgi:3-methylfumaryl-CoA hydratase
LPDAPTNGLGPDGHPDRDDSEDSFLPPVPLPRRMWASSKLEFLAPLQIGEAVTRVSRIVSITEKTGNSGQLFFVEVAHETHGSGGVAIHETQSIVYREAPPAGSRPAPPAPGPQSFDPTPWQSLRAMVPSEPLLFRFSAQTFNSHRIHYDLPYATVDEGYRGLVVHGPLTATLLLDLAQREFGDNALKKFAFRGVTPAICGELLYLVLRNGNEQVELGAYASNGRHVMSATATL